ncbi:MFS transporter, partial [Rothia aeria]|uniref:MFS transporter n=1 Tax=Rothia aeria TaxID=172042 RepID=UPI003C79B306
PESVRFLESKGRTDEAERVVAEFESSAALSTQTHANETASGNASEAPANDTQEATSIWSAPLRKRTLALCTVWFCINLSYYGAFIWIPSLLSAQGFSLVKSFAFTLIMTLAQLPGYAVAAYLIEKWGRRATLALFLAGSAGAAVCYGLSHSDFYIILSGCFLSFFNLGAWGALYAISPEVFPTRLRGTGTGTAAGLGRIASILAPLIVPPLISFGGTGVLFAVFAAAFLLAAVTTFALPEKRGKSL